MTFTIGVVAHTSRLYSATCLASLTAAAHTSIDDGKLGCTHNHLNVWRWHAQHNPQPWSVVLEDDAQPVDDFTNQLAAALHHAPTSIVSLYLGRQRPPGKHQTRIAHALANTGDACYLLAPKIWHAVGLAIRTHLAGSLVRSINTRLPIDEAITVWAKANAQQCAYTLPSLVDHADTPTIVRHRDGVRRQPGRIAWQTGQREHWTPTTVQLR